MRYYSVLLLTITSTILYNNCAEKALSPIDKKITVQKIITDVTALQQVARNTVAFIKRYEDRYKDMIHAGLLPTTDVTLAAVKETLSFISNVIEHDKGKQHQRILDPQFLQRHFKFLSWNKDQEPIRITKYLVYRVQGSPVKTKDFPYALYEVPDKFSDMLTKYTKQDVLNGALTKSKKAKALVWLNREGLEEALMQGTVVVTMPQGKDRMFNVAHNNGIAYDRSIKDKLQQKRYWSFKELGHFAGWGPDAEHPEHKISILPNVTFAGDVKAFGIGKIIFIEYNDPQTGTAQARIGILADTGGAFENNLQQFDFFTGVYSSHEEFKKGTSDVPDWAQAYILIKK